MYDNCWLRGIFWNNYEFINESGSRFYSQHRLRHAHAIPFDYTIIDIVNNTRIFLFCFVTDECLVSKSVRSLLI